VKRVTEDRKAELLVKRRKKEKGKKREKGEKREKKGKCTKCCEESYGLGCEIKECEI
jgi:hypothetical protein